MSIRNKLGEIMDAKGVSDPELAFMTGLNRMTIYKSRLGGNVTIKNAKAIAKALGESVDAIWPEDEEVAA